MDKFKVAKIIFGILLIAMIPALFIIGFSQEKGLNERLNIRSKISLSATRQRVRLRNVVDKSTNISNVDIVDYVVDHEDRGGEVTFDVNLENVGETYSFVLTVNNTGLINSMVESLTKTNLTEDQQKYVDYNVTYYDGIEISPDDLIKRDETDMIKVTVTYNQNDEVDYDTINKTLTLSFKLTYIEADEHGKERDKNYNVDNNIVYYEDVDNDNVMDIGEILNIGSQKFYILGTDGSNVKALALYNIDIDEETLVQNRDLTGEIDASETDAEGNQIYHSLIQYSDEVYWSNEEDYPNSYIYDENSNLYDELERYKEYIKDNTDIDVEVKLLSLNELISLGCNEENKTCETSIYSWLDDRNYWIGDKDGNNVYIVRKNNKYEAKSISEYYGIRPVILIDSSLIN